MHSIPLMDLVKDTDNSIVGGEPKETTETTDDLTAENPQEAPTLQQMEKLSIDVLDITQRIENLAPVLDLQSIKEVKQLKNKMETWEAQMVGLNKFHMQVLHSSALTLSLLREHYADTKEDKQEARDLYKFLSTEWSNTMEATRVRKAPL